MSDVIRLAPARVTEMGALMQVMNLAFDPVFGEAWSSAQMLTLFALPSARICLAWQGSQPAGFYASRVAGPESELLLLAVDPASRGQGIGGRLIDDWLSWASEENAEEYFLEMRADNDAIHLYHSKDFLECGRRSQYYKGADGSVRDAITMRLQRPIS